MGACRVRASRSSSSIFNVDRHTPEQSRTSTHYAFKLISNQQRISSANCSHIVFNPLMTASPAMLRSQIIHLTLEVFMRNFICNYVRRARMYNHYKLTYGSNLNNILLPFIREYKDDYISLDFCIIFNFCPRIKSNIHFAKKSSKAKILLVKFLTSQFSCTV